MHPEQLTVTADMVRGLVDGQFPAWVELYNTTAAPLDISDWSLSDSLSSPRKFIFPAGTTIGPGDYLTLWLDDATTAPGLHTIFDVKTRTPPSVAFPMPRARGRLLFQPLNSLIAPWPRPPRLQKASVLTK